MVKKEKTLTKFDILDYPKSGQWKIMTGLKPQSEDMHNYSVLLPSFIHIIQLTCKFATDRGTQWSFSFKTPPKKCLMSHTDYYSITDIRSEELTKSIDSNKLNKDTFLVNNSVSHQNYRIHSRRILRSTHHIHIF